MKVEVGVALTNLRSDNINTECKLHSRRKLHSKLGANALQAMALDSRPTREENMRSWVESYEIWN